MRLCLLPLTGLLLSCGPPPIEAETAAWLELAGYRDYVERHVDVVDVKDVVATLHVRRGGVAYVGALPRRVEIEREESFRMAVTLVHEAAHHEQWARDGRVDEHWATLAELEFLTELTRVVPDYMVDWQSAWDSAVGYGELDVGDGERHHGAFGLILQDATGSPLEGVSITVHHSDGAILAEALSDSAGRVNQYRLRTDFEDTYRLSIRPPGAPEARDYYVYGGGGERSLTRIDVDALE